MEANGVRYMEKRRTRSVTLSIELTEEVIDGMEAISKLCAVMECSKCPLREFFGCMAYGDERACKIPAHWDYDGLSG